MDKELDRAIINTIKGGARSLLLLFLCVGFLGIGMVKLVSLPEMVDYFKVWGFPKWSMYLIGIVEVVLAVVIFYLPTRKVGLFGLIMLMLGASGLHIYNQEFSYLIAPMSILFGALMLLWIEMNNQK